MYWGYTYQIVEREVEGWRGGGALQPREKLWAGRSGDELVLRELAIWGRKNDRVVLVLHHW
jgi:hypothetical protein